MATSKKLPATQKNELLAILENRFNKHMNRHKGIAWADVEKRLEAQSEKLWNLHEMEMTGGEPDVVNFDKKSGAYTFVDCSAESPAGRRSFCYDAEALEARKEHKPTNSALEHAADIGIRLLNETEYRALQQLGKFDTKTSSWLLTPDPVRKLGGALFGDFRYGQVFVYHNGVQSYYAARGYRGSLVV